MNTAAEHWAEQARYDLDSARAMLDSGRYLYVLFCCQQAVEKMLKSLIARRKMEFPPRVHQLMRLAEAAGLAVEEERAAFLRELSAYYIQTRYPEEVPGLLSQVNAEMARVVMEQTEEVIQWLSSIP
jgi:HEPN domain-containing protein